MPPQARSQPPPSDATAPRETAFLAVRLAFAILGFCGVVLIAATLARPIGAALAEKASRAEVVMAERVEEATKVVREQSQPGIWRLSETPVGRVQDAVVDWAHGVTAAPDASRLTVALTDYAASVLPMSIHAGWIALPGVVGIGVAIFAFLPAWHVRTPSYPIFVAPGPRGACWPRNARRLKLPPIRRHATPGGRALRWMWARISEGMRVTFAAVSARFRPKPFVVGPLERVDPVIEQSMGALCNAFYDLDVEGRDPAAVAEGYLFDDGIVVVREEALRRRFLEYLRPYGHPTVAFEQAQEEEGVQGRWTLAVALERADMLLDDPRNRRREYEFWRVRIGGHTWDHCLMLSRYDAPVRWKTNGLAARWRSCEPRSDLQLHVP